MGVGQVFRVSWGRRAGVFLFVNLHGFALRHIDSFSGRHLVGQLEPVELVVFLGPAFHLGPLLVVIFQVNALLYNLDLILILIVLNSHRAFFVEASILIEPLFELLLGRQRISRLQLGRQALGLRLELRELGWQINAHVVEEASLVSFELLGVDVQRPVDHGQVVDLKHVQFLHRHAAHQRNLLVAVEQVVVVLCADEERCEYDSEALSLISYLWMVRLLRRSGWPRL